MARDELPRLLCVGGAIRCTGQRPGPSTVASLLLWLASLGAALGSALTSSPTAAALAPGLMALAVVALAASLRRASSAADGKARSWRQTPRDLWLQGGQLRLPHEGGGRLLARTELLSGHLEQGSPEQNLHTLVLTTHDGDLVSLITPSRRQGRAMLLALGLAASQRQVVFTLPGEAPRKPLPGGFIAFTMVLGLVCGWLLADSLRFALAARPESHAWPLVLPGLGRLTHLTSPRLLLWLGWLYGLVGVPFCALWRRTHPPRPRQAHIGHDGVRIEGEIEFVPWASVSRGRRTLVGLDLVMRHGPPIEINLGQGQLPNSREYSLKEPRAALREAFLRAVDEARHASTVEPTTAASVRALLRQSDAPSPVTPGEEGPYRQGADPHEDLWKILHDGSARPHARVAAVEALAQAQTPAVLEQLKLALDVLVEPTTTEALRRAVASK